MFADLIKNLIKSVSQLRPSMSEVVNMLENLHSNHVREHDEVRLPIRYFSGSSLKYSCFMFTRTYKSVGL